MANPTIFATSILWRITLAATIACAASPDLSGQEKALDRQTQSSTFARFDESVSKAADTLLVSTTQATDTATIQTKAQSNDHAVLDNQRRSSKGAGQSAAAIRLNMLRPTVEPILRSHGVPADLAAIILVESGGRAAALSPKGARGLWQLMPDTARRYGLRVDEIRDERIDLFKATNAAARYLHDLYAQFGDWKLALAAYNTGEANVGSAMTRAHTQDFNQLTSLQMLPLETRNYVPRVLAAATLSGQPQDWDTRHSIANAATVFAVSNP
jgi:soluble lytic murein transglycosylase-like protein